MSDRAPSFTPSATAPFAWSRSAVVLAAFAALTLGATPEAVESARYDTLFCDDDDDDDARRARAARDAHARVGTARSHARRDGEHERAARASVAFGPTRDAIDADVARASVRSDAPLFATSAIPVSRAVIPRRTRALVARTALRAALARAPHLSPEVPPRAGPDPPGDASPISAIPRASARRAMERALEAAARAPRRRGSRVEDFANEPPPTSASSALARTTFDDAWSDAT